jgi:hypothetical protein
VIEIDEDLRLGRPALFPGTELYQQPTFSVVCEANRYTPRTEAGVYEEGRFPVGLIEEVHPEILLGKAAEAPFFPLLVSAR